ncbi:SRPBCC family protein [Pseudoalteromonas xiamenensis]|uniref:SRPBCC family protein n=1 Tax=Pseudoalteromonas xiamenensis TaxID=882626 RepID=UPI0027E46DB4|nr:SRPBCC family protein [Pseudoalteromonas xiamenensis]WMN60622.1 SRPBCC family protein [Pseudoalteromonas xiamenensis]
MKNRLVDVTSIHIIPTTPTNLLTTLLDHNQLSRFFGASITEIRPEIAGAPKGGKGTQRLVSMLGFKFIEEITDASVDKIEYAIQGNFPLKGHRGVIEFYPSDTKTVLRYQITGQVPRFIPVFLMALIIRRDLNLALKKLEVFHAC